MSAPAPAVGVYPGMLDGRLALVTGAGQGNGRAIAIGLAKAGAKVVAADLSEANAAKTADDILSAGGKAWAFRLDVTDFAQCEALAKKVGAEIGDVSILVNNAGVIFREGSESPRAMENWKKTIDVNLHGVFNVTMAWLPALSKAGGNIINVSSTAAWMGHPAAGYAASKAGVVLLTQSHALEFAKHGIRVNAIAPGMVETAMTDATRGNKVVMEIVMARTPLKRPAQPEELVGPVVFLASSMSSYVTGSVVTVDGGYSMN